MRARPGGCALAVYAVAVAPSSAVEALCEPHFTCAACTCRETACVSLVLAKPQRRHWRPCKTQTLCWSLDLVRAAVNYMHQRDPVLAACLLICTVSVGETREGGGELLPGRQQDQSRELNYLLAFAWRRQDIAFSRCCLLASYSGSSIWFKYLL
jgi:hypothetical protein